MQGFGSVTDSGATEDLHSHRSIEEDENYLLLPARVQGYCLKTKVWAQFHVNRIEDVEAVDPERIMKALVFPEESKSVKEDLRILVEQHGSEDPDLPLIADPIAGKGSGLIILLHGW